jgi:hypothetical protein
LLRVVSVVGICSRLFRLLLPQRLSLGFSFDSCILFVKVVVILLLDV